MRFLLMHTYKLLLVAIRLISRNCASPFHDFMYTQVHAHTTVGMHIYICIVHSNSAIHVDQLTADEVLWLQYYHYMHLHVL